MQTKKKAGSFTKALDKIAKLEKENQELRKERKDLLAHIEILLSEVKSKRQVNQEVLESRDTLSGLKEALKRMPRIVKKTMGVTNAKSK